MSFIYTIIFLLGVVIGVTLLWTTLERFSVFVCNKDGQGDNNTSKKDYLKKISNTSYLKPKYMKEVLNKGEVKQVEDEGRFVYYEKK